MKSGFFGRPKSRPDGDPLRPLGALDVLVRVHAVSLLPFGIGVGYNFQALLGTRTRNSGSSCTFTGSVEAVGASVSRFRPGDSVFGMVNNPLAESTLCNRIVVEEGVCCRKPDRFTDAEAVSIIGDAMIAERTLRLVKASENDAILITGGWTPLARSIVKLAKSSMFGVEWIASTVSSIDERSFVESSGVDETFDITCNKGDWSADFTHGVNKKSYDIVIDVVGDSKRAKRLLNRESGRFVSLRDKPTPEELLDYNKRVGPFFPSAVLAVLGSPFKTVFTGSTGRGRYCGHRYFTPIPTGDGEVVDRLAVLMDTETLTPMVERIIPIESTVELAKVQKELESDPFRFRGRVIVDLSDS